MLFLLYPFPQKSQPPRGIIFAKKAAIVKKVCAFAHTCAERLCRQAIYSGEM